MPTSEASARQTGDDRERGYAGDDGDLGDGLERLEEDVGPEQVARPARPG